MIVLPILKKVEETIVGTIKRIENGLNIPPVKYKSVVNCSISYIKNELEYKSFNSVSFILNCKIKFVNNPKNIIMWHFIIGKSKFKKK